jgi:hypothetical protein
VPPELSIDVDIGRQTLHAADACRLAGQDLSRLQSVRTEFSTGFSVAFSAWAAAEFARTVSRHRIMRASLALLRRRAVALPVVVIMEHCHLSLNQLTEGATRRWWAPEWGSRWIFAAWKNYWPGYARHPLFRAGSVLESIASRSWEIAPGETSISPQAYYLENQLERVTGMAYTDNPRRDMAGGVESFQVPTRAFLIKDAWLIDGSLYTPSIRLDLHARRRLSRLRRHLPRVHIDRQIDRAAIYSTIEGNEYFGLWLLDDCVNYPLAEAEGLPITSNQPVGRHVEAYENWLEMHPVRVDGAFLREVVLFDDWGANAHKFRRVAALREKLLSHVQAEPHPGVFILRCGSGRSRIMHNERELAEYLRERRGFRIIDVNCDDVPSIVAACAGARVVIGIEGSHLVHGLATMRPGGALVALQPPFRFCGVLKRMTDAHQQHFGFVVGEAEGAGFRVDAGEVERTLDLLPACGF